MQRFYRILLFASLLGCSWLGMQAVHELGHVLGARATGGKVSQVLLSPLEFSRTELAVNPCPLAVCWGGPILGSLLPLVAWAFLRVAVPRQGHLARFFAGFCLVTNGAYIGGGALVRAGDAGDLLRYGAPWWQLLLFGVAAVAGGLGVWHRLGSQFAPRSSSGADQHPNDGKADRNTALGLAALLAAIFAAEVWLGG